MCNCNDLSEIVFDLDSSQHTELKKGLGRHAFPSFFAEFEVEEFEPALSYSELYYCCKCCGQPWYIECAPEELTFALFGIKLQDNDQRLTTNTINSKKQFITLLAHNGFGAEKCRHQTCDNHSLNGKELCHNHLSLI